MPETVRVARGFVVADGFASHQTDVLIYDRGCPVLFQDGDLVFITPDAVRGLISVKSKVDRAKYRKAIRELCRDAGEIRRRSPGQAFAGLFAFESGLESMEEALTETKRAATSWDQRLDFAGLGDAGLIKYWHLDPVDERQFYQRWHAYRLPEMAAGYFIHNVIEAVAPESVSKHPALWFPLEGKEPYKVGEIRASWT